MIDPKLIINIAFIEHANKFMKTTFSAITRPHIKTTLAKKKTIVLALLMFYEAKQNPLKKSKC